MSTRASRSPAIEAILILILASLAAACTADDGTPAAPTALQPVPAAAAPPVPDAPASSRPRYTPSTVEGVYAMSAPLVSELRVVALAGRHGAYRVEVHGGGNPLDGAGVGADCQALAEGPLEGNRIEAPLLPFESPLGGLDTGDLADAPRLRLTIDGDQAELDGRFAHCALATVMAGHYVRTETPALWVDCPPLPAACWMRD